MKLWIKTFQIPQLSIFMLLSYCQISFSDKDNLKIWPTTLHCSSSFILLVKLKCHCILLNFYHLGRCPAFINVNKITDSFWLVFCTQKSRKFSFFWMKNMILRSKYPQVKDRSCFKTEIKYGFSFRCLDKWKKFSRLLFLSKNAQEFFLFAFAFFFFISFFI